MEKIINSIENNMPQLIAIFMGVYFALKIVTEIFGIGGDPTPEELIADGYTPVYVAYEVRADGIRETYYTDDHAGYFVVKIVDKGADRHFVSDIYSHGLSGDPVPVDASKLVVTHRGDFLKLDK